MSTKGERPLKIFFIPLMSPGHMIPMVEIAKLFASRPQISATVVTTPRNEPLVRPQIASSPQIHLLLLPFPQSVAHLLPNSQENLTSITSSDFPSFMAAFFALKDPLDDLLRLHRPDCIVSDSLFIWTADTAAELGIPRLVFYGHGAFASCVHDSLERHAPYAAAAHDDEPFAVEGLPRPVQMTRREVSAGVVHAAPLVRPSVEKSFGVIVNSFRALEAEFADHYGRSRNAFYVGPVRCLREWPAEDGGSIIGWLRSKERGSVVYVCFGSLNEFGEEQLREIGSGLEEAGRPFVWVVRGKGEDGRRVEEINGGMGLVVRGWAPQAEILTSGCVGGFVTHCGWNSVLEGVGAGVAMVTWPVEYEQFVNEKLVVDVLGIGVRVRGRGGGEGIVKGEEVARAVEMVMGEEVGAGERRRRVREYAAMAAEAVEEGGSSFVELTRLIDEIKNAKVWCGPKS